MSTTTASPLPGPTSNRDVQSDPLAKVDKVSQDNAEDEEEERDADEKDILHGMKLLLAFMAMLFSMFLVALDVTIVATAAPVIASDFNSLNKITWVFTGFIFTQTTFILPFGQYLIIWPTKWVYLISVFIFELGSLFCGIAKSIDFLIFGRAVAVTGAAGIFVSIFTIISQITRLKDRPLFIGFFGGVFGVSSVIGPLIGGALTDKVSWRWCFYINLPIGCVSLLLIFFIVEARPAISTRKGAEHLTGFGKLRELDLVGTVLSFASIVSLLLALQWGGNGRPWNDATVIALIVISPILFFVFLAWEHYVNDKAMMPLVLFRRKTQWGASLIGFFTFFSMLLSVYYLPIFFQAVRHHSAARSGVDIIPFMLSMVLSIIISGGVVKKSGHYWGLLFLGPLVSAVGAGLLFTIDEHTPLSKLIGYQILFGVGVGIPMQSCIIALMADVTSRKMIPQAVAVAAFFQRVGGTIGLAIAGAVFNNQLGKQLYRFAPEVNPIPIRHSVAAIYTFVPPQFRGAVIHAYAKALDHVYIIGVATAILASLSALLVANHNIVKMDKARLARMEAKVKAAEETSSEKKSEGASATPDKEVA